MAWQLFEGLLAIKGKEREEIKKRGGKEVEKRSKK
jgi:hypothetical protein